MKPCGHPFAASDIFIEDQRWFSRRIDEQSTNLATLRRREIRNLTPSSTWCGVLFLCIIFFGCSQGFSQNPQFPASSRSFPTVIFSVDNWGANPSHYSIAIDSTGNATYKAVPNSARQNGDPYVVEFPASANTRDEIFRLAGRLRFFKGHFAIRPRSAEHGVEKTLTFRDERENNSISYGSSRDVQIRQLATLFQQITATLEFGRHLSYLHQHHDPGLARELERMEFQAEKHRLREMQAVNAVLQEIATDQNIDRTARKRAKALLALPTRGGTAQEGTLPRGPINTGPSSSRPDVSQVAALFQLPCRT